MMPNSPAGRAPVSSSAVVPAEGRANAAQQNYLTIVDTLKQNSGAETKAIKAMFGGDKALMDTFLAVAFSSLANNSDLLLKATPMSIIQSIKDAAALGLKPDGIEGAIVRYTDTAKFMPMYQGYKRRMLRSGKVMAVDAKAVYTEDEFDYWTGPMGTEFTHHPAKARRDPDTGERISSRGTWLGFYAYARTPDGFVYFRYLDVDEVNRIRDAHGQTHSRDGKPLPWVTDYEQMALKTVIRQLQKDVPQEANAVDPLLRIERENDEAIAALRQSSKQLDDGLSEVRDLALRAVGQLPPGPLGPEQDASAAPVAPAGAGATREDVLAATTGDPGADPDLAAALAFEDEQRRRGTR
jgi:phage RecT family recombinase